MKTEIQRVARPREKARESYNSMSRWYDLFTGSEKRFTDMGIQMLNVQPDESILEVGCGTGHALGGFTKRSKGGSVIAIDISEKMLKVARKKIKASNAELCQADGLFIPFPDGKFDAIFISFTLELFDTPDMPRVLSECCRVLKTDGRIGIVALAKQGTTAVRIYEWFHKRMPTLVDCRPIYLRSVLEEGNFDIQQSTLKTMWELPVEIVVAQKGRLLRRDDPSSAFHSAQDEAPLLAMTKRL